MSSFLETYKFHTPALPDTTRIAELAEELFAECMKHGMGDPFVPGRLQEIIMAHKLGHRISETLAGADAYDQDGACEYKSTIKSNITGAYKGISKFPTWEEQVEYLEQKIAGCTNHYIARFENGVLVEAWKLKGTDVLNILLPRLHKQYISEDHKKDPRLAVTLSKCDIYEYGERII